MSAELDVDAAVRQAFGPGFDFLPGDRSRAEAIAGGVLHLSPHEPADLGAEPTWAEDPFGQTNWLFQYHSLRWLDVFRRRAAAGDPEAMRVWERYVRSWLEANDPADPASPWAWRDMVDGLRAQVLAYGAPYLGDTDWLRDALEIHGAWLADPTHLHHGNHALAQHVGLFVTASVLRRADWRDLAVSRLGDHLLHSYDADGVNEEASTAYQLLNLRWWRAVEERLRRERTGPLPGRERLDLAPEFLAHATRPDGALERIGDTDAASATGLADPRIDYVTTQGEQGSPPADLRRVYPAGYAFGRTGWGETGRSLRDETFYSLRFGRQDAIHGHPDGGSVTLWSAGVPWLTGVGKYAYDGSPTRRWVLSREGQNAVSVAGRRHDRRVPVRLVAQRHENDLDVYALEDRGFRGVVIRRLVCFSRRGEWLLVQDRVRADDQATVRSHLHLGAGVEVLASGRSIVLGHGNARATLTFAGSRPRTRVVEGSDDPVAGWVSQGWTDRTATPEIVLEKDGRTASITMVLTPVDLGPHAYLRAVDADADAIVIDVPGVYGVDRVRIERDGVRTVWTGADEVDPDSGEAPPTAHADLLALDATAAELARAGWNAAGDRAATLALFRRVTALVPGAGPVDQGLRSWAEDLLAEGEADVHGRRPGTRTPLPRYAARGRAEIHGAGGPSSVATRSWPAAVTIELGTDTVQHHLIDLGRLVLPLRVTRGTGDVLTVVLHGALNRARDRLPRFERVHTHSRLGLPTLAVGDPTLDLAEDLPLAWYLGTAGLDLHAALARRVREVVEGLELSRVLLIGSSGGGFAALQVAAHLERADVLVFNPQTDVRRYHRRLARQALTTVFGSDVDAIIGAPGTVERVDAIARLRGSTADLRVTYVQNVHDRHHVDEHLRPFLAARDEMGALRDLDLREVEWEPGHANATPERYLDHLLDVLSSSSAGGAG